MRGPTEQARLALMAAIAPLAWGTTYAVTSELLPPDRPMTAALLRALPAGLLLLLLSRQLPPRGWWGRVIVLGVLNIGAFFPLLFFAAYRLPGTVAAVVGALGPFITAAMVVSIGLGRPPSRQLMWAGVAAVGVVLTAVGGDFRLDGWGMLAAVMGAVSMSAGTVLTRRWGQPPGMSGLALTGWELVVGGLVVAPLVPLLDTGEFVLDTSAVAGYAWLTLVGTAIAYTLWFRAARRLPPLQMSLLTRLSPVTAAAVGWLWLDQALSLLQVIGFVVALVAALIAQRTVSKPRPSEAAGVGLGADTCVGNTRTQLSGSAS